MNPLSDELAKNYRDLNRVIFILGIIIGILIGILISYLIT